MFGLNNIAICIVLSTFAISHAFFGSLRSISNHVSTLPATVEIQPSSMALESTRGSSFGSRLLPVYSDEELNDLFKELNITRFDLENDPEIMKWAPSKEFFEKFGFQNNTEKYKRKVTDVKIDFYKAYTKPLLPQYKTFIADMLAVSFIQVVDSRYKYDALHAFGLCTQYYTVMKGYPLQDEVSSIPLVFKL